MPRNPNRYGGGSRTNRNGLHFEQTTSLNEALRNAGFEIRDYYDVYFNGQLIGHSINKAEFSTVFLRANGINDRLINSKDGNLMKPLSTNQIVPYILLKKISK